MQWIGYSAMNTSNYSEYNRVVSLLLILTICERGIVLCLFNLKFIDTWFIYLQGYSLCLYVVKLFLYCTLTEDVP